MTNYAQQITQNYIKIAQDINIATSFLSSFGNDISNLGDSLAKFYLESLQTKSNNILPVESIDWANLPYLVPGYFGEGKDVKFLSDLGTNGGFLMESTIEGSQQTCLSNDIDPKNNIVPKNLTLKNFHLVPNAKGTYWGARLYNLLLVFEDGIVQDMYGDTSKPEGHGLYTNPAFMQIIRRCVFKGNAANPIQSANRPWEAGSQFFCTYWEVSENKFIENHPANKPSDRAGFLVTNFGLGPECVYLIENNTIQELNAQVIKDGVTYGSVGCFCSVPVTQPPGWWTGPAGWWAPGQNTGKLLRIQGNQIVMRKPSQEVVWTHANQRVEFVNNNLTFIDGIGNAAIQIDPLIMNQADTKSFLIAGNTGTPIPVFHKGILIGDTSKTLTFN